MRFNQKSVGKNGLQNALFPMDCMYITQGSGGGYSHVGTYAIDFVGWNGSNQVNQYPYYAPFDCTLTSKLSDGSGVIWTSDNNVNTPSGVKRISLVCIHDNNAINMNVGEKRKQGQLLGHTGTAGNVTGDHVHFEAFIQGKEWSRPDGMIQMYDVFYIDGTRIYNHYDYNWRHTGQPIDIDIICTNDYLTREEMRGNAQYIAYYFTNLGWSSNAIAGMLGNMEVESTINPCLWQGRQSGNLQGGFGLVQWTPATNLINWANSMSLPYADMDTQLYRIEYELENGLQWIATSDYPMSFEEFTVSNETPEYLASAFLKNYERAGIEREQDRRDNARYWYNNLDWSGGHVPSPPLEREKDLIILWLSGALNGW